MTLGKMAYAYRQDRGEEFSEPIDVQEFAGGGAFQEIGERNTNEALDNLDNLFKDLLHIFKEGLHNLDLNLRREAA